MEDMSAEDRVTYLPVTSDQFDPATVELFRSLTIDHMQAYVDSQRREDLPVSLMDFATQLIYDVGHMAGVNEVASGEMAKVRRGTERGDDLPHTLEHRSMVTPDRDDVDTLRAMSREDRIAVFGDDPLEQLVERAFAMPGSVFSSARTNKPPWEAGIADPLGFVAYRAEQLAARLKFMDVRELTELFSLPDGELATQLVRLGIDHVHCGVAGHTDPGEGHEHELPRSFADEAAEDVRHDWVSETLCRCGAVFQSPQLMTAHIEESHHAEEDEEEQLADDGVGLVFGGDQPPLLTLPMEDHAEQDAPLESKSLHDRHAVDPS